MTAFIKQVTAEVAPEHDELNALAIEWSRAKAAETEANARRLELEAKIAELVGTREEGVITLETELFKVKTTGKLTRTVNTEALQEHWELLSPELQKVFTWKASLDTKQLRALESMREDLIPQLANYVITKPAKTSVSVEAR